MFQRNSVPIDFLDELSDLICEFERPFDLSRIDDWEVARVYEETRHETSNCVRVQPTDSYVYSIGV